jgi:hypothetical protein
MLFTVKKAPALLLATTLCGLFAASTALADTDTYAVPAASSSSTLSNTDYTGTWWINGGAGFGVIKGNSTYNDTSNTGPAIGLSFNYAVKNNQLLTIRGLTASNFNLFDGDAYGSDIGVLYGVMKKTDNVMISASAGLAYTYINQSGDSVYNANTNSWSNTYDTTSTIGVPLETQLFWTPTDHFGIGVVGFGNINGTQSFGGALLAVQVGKLKN